MRPVQRRVRRGRAAVRWRASRRSIRMARIATARTPPQVARVARLSIMPSFRCGPGREGRPAPDSGDRFALNSALNAALFRTTSTVPRTMHEFVDYPQRNLEAAGAGGPSSSSTTRAFRSSATCSPVSFTVARRYRSETIHAGPPSSDADAESLLDPGPLTD